MEIEDKLALTQDLNDGFVLESSRARISKKDLEKLRWTDKNSESQERNKSNTPPKQSDGLIVNQI